MRIWDLDPSLLCRQHLLAEHRDLHAIWTILAEDRDGYREHPEVKRWEDRLGPLWHRHATLVDEFDNRDYNHQTPLNPSFYVWGSPIQDEFIDPPRRQREILAEKCDGCRERLNG